MKILKHLFSLLKSQSFWGIVLAFIVGSLLMQFLLPVVLGWVNTVKSKVTGKAA